MHRLSLNTSSSSPASSSDAHFASELSPAYAQIARPPPTNLRVVLLSSGSKASDSRRSSAARHRRSARHRLGRASAGWSHQRRPSGGWSRGSADRPPDRGRGCADAHARHLRGRGREPVRSGSRRLRLRLRLPLELRLDLSGGRRRGSRSAHRGSAGSRSARGADAGRPRGRHHRSRRSARRSTARAGKACFADGIIVRGAREGDRVASGVGGDGVRSLGSFAEVSR